jgi:hypothetical protein
VEIEVQSWVAALDTKGRAGWCYRRRQARGEARSGAGTWAGGATGEVQLVVAHRGRGASSRGRAGLLAIFHA